MSENTPKNGGWPADSGRFPMFGTVLRHVIIGWGVVLAGVVVLILLVGKGSGAGGDLMDRLPPEARREFRSFSVPLLSGGTMDESVFHGRVTLVNVWASWCGPCRRELPELVRVSDAVSDTTFQLITLNDDVSGAAASNFLIELGLSGITVGWGGGRMQPTLGLFGLPHTMLVDRDGRIAYEWMGFGGDAQIGQLRSMVFDELGSE